ncbi:hypothetical protein [Actinomarinicola tropica]|nr:hypothetical protein [Actinomarinicola tropica]
MTRRRNTRWTRRPTPPVDARRTRRTNRPSSTVPPGHFPRLV